MLTLVALLVNGFFDYSPPLYLPYNLPPAVKSQVEEDWPKILASCPGFKKYGRDMIFDRIEDNRGLDKGSSIDIGFKMGSSTIPVEYRAFDHTCYYGISQDGKSMRIQENGCVAVCKGSAIETNVVDYVEAFR
jgi:hypothetical protein